LPKPINRNIILRPLSREHHHGLLLCWKIKQGRIRNIDDYRLMTYLHWFWITYLENHFKVEEKFIFPILGTDNILVQKAVNEHIKLESYFKDNEDIHTSINLIEKVLAKHIRFEERELFNKIQEVASAEQINKIQNNIKDIPFVENLNDTFWI